MLRVRVTPKAGRNEVAGIEPTGDGPAIKVKVRAPPADGEANAAVVEAIADWLDIARRRVRLVAGERSRVKLLAIDGEGGRLSAHLAALVASLGTK